VLVTPRLHFVHHSAKAHVANSNYGFIFSVWDRVFGTYTDPATIPLDDPLGLGYEVSGWRLMLGLPPPRATREIRATRAYAGGVARIESELAGAPSARGK
jgi:hypothetical protein